MASVSNSASVNVETLREIKDDLCARLAEAFGEYKNTNSSQALIGEVDQVFNQTIQKGQAPYDILGFVSQVRGAFTQLNEKREVRHAAYLTAMQVSKAFTPKLSSATSHAGKSQSPFQLLSSYMIAIDTCFGKNSQSEGCAFVKSKVMSAWDACCKKLEIAPEHLDRPLAREHIREFLHETGRLFHLASSKWNKSQLAGFQTQGFFLNDEEYRHAMSAYEKMLESLGL